MNNNKKMKGELDIIWFGGGDGGGGETPGGTFRCIKREQITQVVRKEII